MRKVCSNLHYNIMLRIILLLTLGIKTCYGQTFSGQVFRIAMHYSDDKCAAFGHDECDTRHLFFLSDKEFCMFTNCNGYYYWIGTYLIKDAKVTLTFKQIAVYVDMESAKAEAQRSSLKIDPIECDITSCGQKVKILYNPVDSGSRIESTEERKMIKKLKRTAAWKLLQE